MALQWGVGRVAGGGGGAGRGRGEAFYKAMEWDVCHFEKSQRKLKCSITLAVPQYCKITAQTRRAFNTLANVRVSVSMGIVIYFILNE